MKNKVMLSLKNDIKETTMGFAFVHFDNMEDINFFKKFFYEFQNTQYLNQG